MSFTKEHRDTIKAFILEKVAARDEKVPAKTKEAFQITDNTYYRYIRELCRDGLLVKTGTGVYELTGQGQAAAAEQKTRWGQAAAAEQKTGRGQAAEEMQETGQKQTAADKQEGDRHMGKVYGVVLAGGIGSRMGNLEKPKQFLELGEKPVIIHTVEKFAIHPGFDRVLVLSPRSWVGYTQDIIRKFLPGYLGDAAGEPAGRVTAGAAAGKEGGSRIVVLEGGATRNETIMNAVRYIEKEGDLDEETVIVTHDSVRPFVTHRILEENIRYAKEYGACDTVIPATDTIVESLDGADITSIPNRKYMCQGQTPQSFKAKKLKEVYEALTEEEKGILTDACKIMVLKGERVHLVQGEVFNIKITYPYDVTVAKALLGMEM